MSHGQRKPRIPRWRPADPISHAISMAVKLSKSEIKLLLTGANQCFDALRRACATEQQWRMLSGSIAVARAIEHFGAVKGLSGHIEHAEAALQSVHTRNTSSGQWAPVGMRFDEIADLSAFIDIHGFQLKEISRGEFNQAADRVVDQTISSGGKVDFATSTEALVPESITA